MLSLPVQGENIFPDSQGTVTDLAVVLSEDTIKDFQALDERYNALTGGHIRIVTRHFLGGRDVKGYAKGLFDHWVMGENDMLLLMVIGEESYQLYLGENARVYLPNETVSTYLATYFHPDFMDRRYDAACAQIVTEAAKSVAQGTGQTLNVSGLFGNAQEQTSHIQFSQDISQMFPFLFDHEPDEEEHIYEFEDSFVGKGEKSTGISLWKIILIIWILSMIFKKRKRRRYNFGRR